MMKTNRRQAIRVILGGLAGTTITGRLYAVPKAVPSKDNEGHLLEVFNAGIGGNNTRDLLERLDKDCLSLRPKLTILMAGTNDMNSAKYVPIKEYGRNLAELVRKIKASGSKVLLMSILPIYEPDLFTRHKESFYQPDGVQERRKRLNQLIKEVSDKSHTYFLDLGQCFSVIGKIGPDKDSLLQNQANSNKTDGIHPTASGYRFIALAVYDYLIYHNLKKGSIVCFGDSITKGDGSMDRDSYPAFLKKLLTA